MENKNHKKKDSIVYHKPSLPDVANIVNLINTQAVKDADKIFIVPKKFRSTTIENDVRNNKLYCAYETLSNTVIAFKKIFIINNQKEFNKIIETDLRCSPQHNSFLDGNKLEFTNKGIKITPIKESAIPYFSFNNSVPIYLGTEYTSPEYRQLGITVHLEHLAFSSIKKEIISKIKSHNLTQINIFYGQTTNADIQPDTKNRSVSIMQIILYFIQQIGEECFPYNEDKIKTFYHSRYKTLMPVFDPNSDECIPLPEDQSISAYSNALIFPLGPPFQSRY